MLAEKLEALHALLRSYESCLVAYSGGVDSVFLARVAHDVLGDRSLAVIADSPSLPRRELQEALDIAKQVGFPVRVATTSEFQNPDYLANPVNRCYFCKHELFAELAPLARAEHFAVIAYGENASDAGDFRPGMQAAAEFQVRAPLKEAGLTKSEIRTASAQLGLPTADKPQMACLSSRVPHGEKVTTNKLRMVEAAETVLRDLGFYDVRVRHHELEQPDALSQLPAAWTVLELTTAETLTERDGAGGAAGAEKPALARIELGPSEIPRLRADPLAHTVAAALQKIGYARVVLDLRGYRRAGAESPPTAPVAPACAEFKA